MRNIIRCGLWIIFGLKMSLGWAETGNYFNVTSSGTGATVDIALCLNAGTGQAGSQANCQTMTVANLNLAIQVLNLNSCGRNNSGYANAGLKILTPGYTVASGTTGRNQATGYYTFPVNCSASTSVNLKLANSYTLGGNLSGLGSSKTVTLQNNGANNLVLDTNAPFEFPGYVTEGSMYSVTVQMQPSGQICIVTNGSGTMGSSDVSNITVNCTVSVPTLTNISPTLGPTSGGTSFTLTGSNLTGTTSVTFDGTAATSVHVVDDSTVTGVTPARAASTVNVQLTTPLGTATLASAYTYQTTAVGQPAYGGTIACLNGSLDNLIAATADNSTGIIWGGRGTAIGPTARSDTDGATNTTAIVTALPPGTSYAAGLCDAYEIDSQGNTPCQSGNTCYNDWFLPAKNQLSCLYTNKSAIGGFGSGNYWSSTESSGNPANYAWSQLFSNGSQGGVVKDGSLLVRCVRAFTP